MSGALLISNISIIFIATGISMTISIYLKYENNYNLYKIIRLFAIRYSLFCIVCFLYYFFYLKNGTNTAMKIYWEPYFPQRVFPHGRTTFKKYLFLLYGDYLKVCTSAWQNLLSLPHRLEYISSGVKTVS